MLPLCLSRLDFLTFQAQFTTFKFWLKLTNKVFAITHATTVGNEMGGGVNVAQANAASSTHDDTVTIVTPFSIHKVTMLLDEQWFLLVTTK